MASTVTNQQPASARSDAEASLPLAALLVLCLQAPVAAIALTGMSPVMPQIGAEFAAVPNADILVRLMMSGLSAAAIIGSLLSGFLAERFGQMRLLLVALTTYALSGAVIFLLDDIYLMVACRIVQGVANAAVGVVAMALITTRVAADRRDKWLGFYLVSSMAGTIVLFSAIGTIASYGWRYTFLLFLLALPLAVLLAIFLPKELRTQGEERIAEQTALGAPPPVPWALAGFGVLCGSVSAASPMFLPYHFDTMGLGQPGTIAMLMIGGTVLSGVTTFSFGWLRQRFSAIQFFVVGFALNAAGLVIISFATGAGMVLAGLMVQGMALGLVMPNAFSACAATVRPEWRARLLGFVRAGFAAGPLVAQPVLEVVYRQSSAGATLLAIALASLGGAVWVFLGRRQFDPAQ